MLCVLPAIYALDTTRKSRCQILGGSSQAGIPAKYEEDFFAARFRIFKVVGGGSRCVILVTRGPEDFKTCLIIV